MGFAVFPSFPIAFGHVNAIIDAHAQRDGGDGDGDDVERSAGHVHQTVEPHHHEEDGHEGHDRLLGRPEADGEGTQHEHGAKDERGLHLVLHGGGGRVAGDGSTRQHDPR